MGLTVSANPRRNLECLLAEAHALGRLAILPPLRLAPRHNFGAPRAWRWETYFDLDGSVLVDAAGRPGPLPLARGAIDAGPPVRVGAGEPAHVGPEQHPTVEEFEEVTSDLRSAVDEVDRRVGARIEALARLRLRPTRHVFSVGRL